jgi:hypothetical protein
VTTRRRGSIVASAARCFDEYGETIRLWRGCLLNQTPLGDFIHDGSPARGEALLASEPRFYMGGSVNLTCGRAGIELVSIESPLWRRTGTFRGFPGFLAVRGLKTPGIACIISL